MQRHSKVVLFKVNVKEYRIEVRVRNISFLLVVRNEWTVKALLLLILFTVQRGLCAAIDIYV